MSPLCQLISDHIRTCPDGKIPFATYMDLALYHPEYGYYASHPNLIGAPGDFVTAPHLTADFGELLAVQFEQMWQLLGQPIPFVLVEMGAGQGLVIQDVCRYLRQHYPDCFAALHYRVIEASPALIQAQQHLMKAVVEPGQGVEWSSWSDLADHSVVGCFFSNELVDAFPVHRVQWHQGKLWERYVTLSAADAIADHSPVDPDPDSREETRSPFQEVLGELSTTALHDYFDLVGITWSETTYEEGYHTEVNLAALDWLFTVSTKLKHGYVLTIDYGYPAQRYYSPARTQGTLQCYYNHVHHSNPYLHVGEQDITAHVDFTALERHGEQCGLQTVGYTQQGLFLMALGVGDRLSQLSQLSPSANDSVNDILRRREALHALINPMGMGNFNVLVQSKGISTLQPSAQASTTPPLPKLRGLDIPPMAIA